MVYALALLWLRAERKWAGSGIKPGRLPVLYASDLLLHVEKWTRSCLGISSLLHPTCSEIHLRLVMEIIDSALKICIQGTSDPMSITLLQPLIV